MMLFFCAGEGPEHLRDRLPLRLLGSKHTPAPVIHLLEFPTQFRNLGFIMKASHNDNCGCDGSVRALAASAGIQFADLHAEAIRLRDTLGRDREKAYYDVVRQLMRGGAISESEQRALLELGKRGFA